MMTALKWQRFEGAIVFLSGLAIYMRDAELMPWWIALLVFFTPDLSFAGYAAGPRLGAFVYNAVHIYGFGAVCLALGLSFALPPPAGIGSLGLVHSGFDRMLGYGLKSPEGFTFTHLGRIGKPEHQK